MYKNNNSIINELIELINSFSTAIYKDQNNEYPQLLINIIDKLDLLVGVKSTLDIKNSHLQGLKHKLPDLLEAFENKDKVLMSDILIFEIKPLLDKLLVYM